MNYPKSHILTKISNIRKQIFRSVSSTASNYRAMCRVRSTKQKYSKICIVVEEADEIVKATSSYKKKLGEELKH
ncbi:four helix bundle protein [Chryseobacterium sp. MYb328]|uniref:four helix bundle protein n=1 Tax=Chryseobacterium sp. MYb328 TaxID=2745231 RepID=UPI0030A670FC